LDVSYNYLSSTIPSEIGRLTKLTGLSFAANDFTSTITTRIGLLTKLTYLDFSENTLLGTIPTSLCSLTPLKGEIFIDCGEIKCASGCCVSGDDVSC
jgi:Leucine-rich repeat (LRR) protein